MLIILVRRRRRKAEGGRAGRIKCKVEKKRKKMEEKNKRNPKQTKPVATKENERSENRVKKRERGHFVCACVRVCVFVCVIFLIPVFVSSCSNV